MLKQISRPGKGFGIFNKEAINHDRSVPYSEKRSGDQKSPEVWPDPNTMPVVGTIQEVTAIHQLFWTNSVQPNEKTAIEKQTEGSLTLAEEKPKAEEIRIANQNNEIDLAGQQAAQRFRRTWYFSDQGSTSPVLEHHLVTKIQKRFLQSPYFLLRKYVISVTERLLRCLSTDFSDTEHPCSSGCLAKDVTKKSQEKSVRCFLQN